VARIRKYFRPSGWDLLEERLVLSHIGPRSLHTLGPAVTVGALGDSYTDEYKFYPPDQSRARNWVEILAATRHVNFGGFQRTSQGTPRDQGFAFNWALYGATSTEMVQDQLPGLAAQVAAGQVQYVSIFIGGNDFLYFLRDVATGQIAADQAVTTLRAVEAQAAANFQTAVSTLLTANPEVKLAVATVPDVALLPAVQFLATSPQAQALVSATSQAIRQYDATISATAGSDSRIALVDLASLSAQLGQAPGGMTRFGGTTIRLAPPGDDYHDVFLADGIHVGTVVQGIIADAFVNAIDLRFGAGVKPLSSAQIVRFARQVQAETRHGGGPP
jgi:hypothetical protein